MLAKSIHVNQKNKCFFDNCGRPFEWCILQVSIVCREKFGRRYPHAQKVILRSNRTLCFSCRSSQQNSPIRRSKIRRELHSSVQSIGIQILLGKISHFHCFEPGELKPTEKTWLIQSRNHFSRWKIWVLVGFFGASAHKLGYLGIQPRNR